jgi:hypothetical protein
VMEERLPFFLKFAPENSRIDSIACSILLSSARAYDYIVRRN